MNLIEAYHGIEPLPFEARAHLRAVIEIVEAKGIESLNVVELS